MRSFSSAVSPLARSCAFTGSLALTLALTGGMLTLAPTGARAQLSNGLYATIRGNTSSINAYNATTGLQLFSTTGLAGPEGLALFGNTLFVVENNAQRVST